MVVSAAMVREQVPGGGGGANVRSRARQFLGDASPCRYTTTGVYRISRLDTAVRSRSASDKSRPRQLFLSFLPRQLATQPPLFILFKHFVAYGTQKHDTGRIDIL